MSVANLGCNDCVLPTTYILSVASTTTPRALDVVGVSNHSPHCGTPDELYFTRYAYISPPTFVPIILSQSLPKEVVIELVCDAIYVLPELSTAIHPLSTEDSPTHLPHNGT
jgi:hypothetical protein